MNIWELPLMPNRHRISVAWNSLKERLQGLDFSMPDRMYDRGRKDGGMYTATPDRVLRDMFACVDRKRYGAFLDIGCGKGYVLWQAKAYGFQRVGGGRI